MRQRSPEFWARVRTVNWILGGVGLFFSLFYALSNQQERVQMPDRTISRLVFSPDGRTLVGYGSWIEPGVRLGETRAWDVRTGKRLWSESHAVSDVLPGTFLPDGSSLVTVRAAYHAFRSDKHQEYRPGYDVFLRLTFRDARTGRTSPQEAVFLGSPRSARFKHKPTSIDVSPNGRSIAVAAVDGVVVWNAPTKTGGVWEEHWFAPKTAKAAKAATGGKAWRPVASARFTPDSRHLVVLRTSDSAIDYAGVVMTAEVWDARTGAGVRSFNGSLPVSGKKPVAYRNQLMALSSDRQRIATLSHRDLTARFGLWDVETGKRLRDFSAPGFSAGSHFDHFVFTTERTKNAILGKSAAARLPESKGDILSFRTSKSFRISESSDWRCWIPGTNRITRDWPEKRLVMDEDEAVSPDGRLIAEPGGKGHARSVWLREFGAWEAAIGME